LHLGYQHDQPGQPPLVDYQAVDVGMTAPPGCLVGVVAMTSASGYGDSSSGVKAMAGASTVAT